MFEPERPTEPKEPALWGFCECCGGEIYCGEEYFYMPEHNLADIVCEDCAREWLDLHKYVAEGRR